MILELIASYWSHSLLHPQHYLVIELMHSLAIAYSSRDRLTRPQQERKVQLCSQVLQVGFKYFERSEQEFYFFRLLVL